VSDQDHEGQVFVRARNRESSSSGALAPSRGCVALVFVWATAPTCRLMIGMSEVDVNKFSLRNGCRWILQIASVVLAAGDMREYLMSVQKSSGGKEFSGVDAVCWASSWTVPEVGTTGDTQILGKAGVGVSRRVYIYT